MPTTQPGGDNSNDLKASVNKTRVASRGGEDSTSTTPYTLLNNTGDADLGTDIEASKATAHEQQESIRFESHENHPRLGTFDGASGERQTRMRRIFEYALACVGVSFSNSPWHVYALQLVGMGSQVWVLYFSMSEEYHYTRREGSTANFQQQTFWLVEVLILTLPSMFLWHLTRCSSERAELRHVVSNPDVSAWMVVMAFIANVGIAATGGFFLGSWVQFSYRFIVLLPSSLALLLCFGYSIEWSKRVPVVDSVGELDDKVVAYEAATRAKIAILNRGFIVPNAVLLFFWTADTFWVLVDYVHGENFDDQLSHSENMIGEGLLVAFAIVHFVALLLPPAHHTSNMDAFVANLDREFCKTEGATGVLLWLNRQRLGWKVFAVVISPEFLLRVAYVAGLAGVTALARAL